MTYLAFALSLFIVGMGFGKSRQAMFILGGLMTILWVGIGAAHVGMWLYDLAMAALQ